jgi:polysaccharide biosynthesis/export protein
VKTLWAVACAVAVSSILFLLGNGCTPANSQIKLKKEPGQGKYPPSIMGTSNPIVVAQEASPAPSQSNNDNGSSQVNITRAIRPQASSWNSKTKAEDYSGGPKYLIGPEDVLHVSVWGNKDLTLENVTVRPDGKISLPLIQDIQAEGLTASELSDVIHQQLLPFILEPHVAVIVTQVNAPKVFVFGNVIKPGPYLLRGDMSVLQALSLAGGFTTFASPKKIKVIRNVRGKQEIRKVNYYDIIDDGVGNYILKPGDMIVVP